MRPVLVLAFVGLSFAAPTILTVSAAESPGLPEETTLKAMLQDADRLFGQQKYDQALKAYKKARGSGGDDCLDCLLGMARSYIKLGAQKNAIEACQRIEQLAGDDKRMQGAALNIEGLAIFEMASDKRDQKKYAQAEALFRKALEATPDTPIIHYNLGMALLSRGLDSEGLDEMRAYVEKEPAGTNVDSARRMIENPRRAREAYAPDFSFSTLDREYISLEDLRGKVVVLDFWGTWCPPCVRSLPDLMRLARKMAAEPVVIISVSSDTDEATWRSFIVRNGMTWPQYLDHNHAVQASYNVEVFPTYVVIDAEGILRARLVGAWAVRDLQDVIRKSLKARPAPGTR